MAPSAFFSLWFFGFIIPVLFSFSGRRWPGCGKKKGRGWRHLAGDPKAKGQRQSAKGKDLKFFLWDLGGERSGGL
jgi:hypothetical protein